MNQHKPHRRLLAMGLALVMALGTTPVSVSAYAAAENSGEIIAFEALSEETINRTVSLGTSLEDLDLPDTLNATVRVATATDADEDVQDSGEPAQEQDPDEQEETDAPDGAANAGTDEPDGDSANGDAGADADEPDGEPVSGNNAPDAAEEEEVPAGDEQQTGTPSDAQGTAAGDEEGSPQIQTSTGSAIALGNSGTELEDEEDTQPDYMDMDIPVPVVWVSAPNYDGETAGIYTFTAKITGFTVSTELPTITVMVGTPAGAVTAFDDLASDIRWQSVEFGTPQSALNLPTALSGTIEGEAAEVPVTWEDEPAYDANTKGLYIFTAKLAEGFSATAELPHITVVVRAGQPQNRMFVRGFGGGAQDTDPFLIGTAAQLADIATLTNEGKLETMFLGTSGTVYLKLDNDLDLSGIDPNGDSSGWVPIGRYTSYNDTAPFKGNFDGANHKITGLTINRPNADYQGLFGYIEGGTVKNLGVVGADITGNYYVGGVAGYVYSRSTVQNCYSTGKVSGSDNVGGVVGYVSGNVTDSYSAANVSGSNYVGGVTGYLSKQAMGTSPSVERCYSTGAVSGNDYVGGVAGYVYCTVENCYSTGAVSGNDKVGGVVGYVYGTVKNCAALNPEVSGTNDVGRVAGYGRSGLSGNIAFSGMTVLVNGSSTSVTDNATGKDGTGKSAAEITEEGFFQTVFDDDTAWTYATGKLPILKNIAGQDDTMPAHIVDIPAGQFFKGTGEDAENAYQISTAAQLAKLAELVNSSVEEMRTAYNSKHYKLTADIDLSGYASGEGWVPIGNYIYGGVEVLFRGSFEGASHKITGLTINRQNADYQGLFGYIYGGTVRNLGILGADITGGNNVGGVAGYVTGTVQNCYNTGSVSGKNYVGGVTGDLSNPDSIIKNCYNIGNINGVSIVGGITGRNNMGTVQNCYASGQIKGTGQDIGGIVGENAGPVKNCVALNPSVSGHLSVGRVTGRATYDTAEVQNSYAFSGMTVLVNGTAKTTSSDATGIDGANKTASELFTDTSFWTTASNGDTAAWSDTIWEFADGKLPILVGLVGQSAALPEHLLVPGAVPFEGAGTNATDPYLIATAADLAKLAELVNSDDEGTRDAYNDKYYKLTADIDLSDIDPNEDGTGWVPIGKYRWPETPDYSFKGTFDGNHKIISGLYINRTGGFSGVFGQISEATIKNLGLTDVNVQGGNWSGGIAALALTGASIENCFVTGLVSGGQYVGGIAGFANGTASGDKVSIENCYSNLIVTSTGELGKSGGIAGSIQYGSINNCYTTGNIAGFQDAGGISGRVGSKSTIRNCAALNEKIIAPAGIGRIGVSSDYTGTDAFSNNIAFSGMKVVLDGTEQAISDGAADNKNGTDLTSAALFGGSIWSASGNWGSGSTWGTDTIWTVEDGKLPILAGLPGQSGAPGLYLLNFSTDELTVTLTGTGITASGTGYTALASYDARSITVNVTGMANWTDPKVTITAAQSAGGGSIAVTSSVNGSGTFDIPVQFSGPITVNATSASNPNNKKTVTLTVSKRDLTVEDFGTTTIIAHYTGSDQGVIEIRVPGSSDKMIVKYNGEDSRPKNVGSYAITLHYDGNDVYNETATGGINIGTYIVNKVPLTLNTDGSTAAPKTYDGTTAATITGIAFNGLVNGQTLSIDTDYTVTNAIFNSANVQEATTVTATVTLTDSEIAKNYSLPNGVLSILQTINKASATGVSQTYEVVKNHAQDYSFDLTTLLPALRADQSFGNVNYALSTIVNSEGVLGELTYSSGNTLTLPVKSVDAADKNATVTVTITSDNYMNFTATIIVKTVDKTPVTIAANMQGGVYNGQARSYRNVTVTKITDGSPVTGITLEEKFEKKNGESTYAPITGAPKDAGEYRLTLSVPESNSTYTGSNSFTFVIDKRPVTVKADSKSMTKGGTIPDFTYTVEEQLTDETALDGTPAVSCTADGQTAGIFDITVDMSGVTGYTGNYKAAIPASVKGTLTVNKPAPIPDVGGGSSSGSTTIITTPGKTPNQPVTAAAPVTATAGRNGAASAAIPEKSITDAIAKAQADAKAQGKTANGIGISVNVSVPKFSKSLTLVLTQPVLKRLVDGKVQQFEVNGQILTITLDQNALAEIQKQSTGNVTITLKPTTAKGVRNAYDITLSYVKDGKTVNITSLGTGSVTISIPCTPGKNEATGYLYAVYVDGKGKINRIAGSAYDANSGSVIFSTNHFSVYGIGYTAPSAKLADISSHWAKESIDYVVGRGLLSGTAETTFAPDTAMTRGMLVAALGRLAGVDVKAYTTNSFTDVKADSAFRPYIEWAYKKGIVQGIGNSQFAPDRVVTREEIAVILANFAKATGYTLPVTRTAATYADASSIGSAYKTAVTAMQQAGIMMGEQNNKFNPKASATRAEVSAMLHRYIKLTIDPTTAQGWAKNDDGQFLYYKNGKALAGTQIIGGTKYFFNTDGTLKTGWVQNGGNWYYYSGNKQLTGWCNIGSGESKQTYYFDTYGNMISGKWIQIEGKWYYFNADGSLAKSTTVDGYEIDENGVRKTK